MAAKLSSPIAEDIGAMRVKYRDRSELFLEKDLVSNEPISQFKNWLEEACKTPGILEPNAMCLATASKDGSPSCRYVLLKSYGSEGFKFFTNYSSRKARDLAENPKAALTFYWEPLKRSVRIEGSCEKVSAAESDKYFHERPRDSQLGACTSHQSSVIKGREELDVREKELREKYGEDKEIDRPEEWGGYLVVPHVVEFWQGQSNRVHDRIVFRKADASEANGTTTFEGADGWVFERLAP
ncbi:pyridoxine/pyridoxamine 5'-phosphate oxidase-like isoform X2 [Neocloeon triangulifer]|nr:pyridoxine/pyridoxamine 5'-phosphate oxidase-like isoform X2 [Neocloeon triangulifer]